MRRPIWARRVKERTGHDDTCVVSTLDVPAVAGARVRLAWDAAALAAATAGALLLLTRPHLGWGVLLMLAVAASALGATRRWWPILVAAVSLLGCAVALARSLASEGPGADVGRWAALTVAVLVAAGIAELVLQRLQHERSEVERAVTFARDIAVHDPLTGLTNRRGLALLGGQILESARRRGDAVYCIFLDVDGLSKVNDALGHSAGDDVLLTVAEALRRSSRATDAVARWGDDEFVVVGPGTGLAPLEMERRIRAHCVEHTSIDRRVWQARVSAGGSVLEPWDDGTVDTILRLAGREMHLRRALRREADAPAYRPARLDQSPQPPHPRQPGGSLA